MFNSKRINELEKAVAGLKHELREDDKDDGRGNGNFLPLVWIQYALGLNAPIKKRIKRLEEKMDMIIEFLKIEEKRESEKTYYSKKVKK